MTDLDFPTGAYSRRNLVTFKIIGYDEPTERVVTNQTGRFPVGSRSSNMFIMVAYVGETNAILAELMTNRAEATIVATYEKICDALCQRRLKPAMQIYNNECPAKF